MVKALLANRNKFVGYNWHGFLPPQYIFSKRKFRKVVLEPPDSNPGSWRGAGKTLVDYENETFWMTTRPRKVYPVRGYAVEIYKSKDGENYNLVTEMDRETIESMAGITINSIEGTQLLKDPLTGNFYLYLAIDTPPSPGWDTLLLTAEDPRGPWEAHGTVIKRGATYDSIEARDAVIDIVDGRYFSLYKAGVLKEGEDGKRYEARMALATSSDGVKWVKWGLLKVEGQNPPTYMQLYGKILAGALGPVFLGVECRTLVRGPCAVTDTFVAYTINHRNLNLERIFSARWDPQSPYEREDYPIHAYLDLVHDPFSDRILIYIEAIDPKDIGLNQERDRVLLYEVPL